MATAQASAASAAGTSTPPSGPDSATLELGGVAWVVHICDHFRGQIPEPLDLVRMREIEQLEQLEPRIEP